MPNADIPLGFCVSSSLRLRRVSVLIDARNMILARLYQKPAGSTFRCWCLIKLASADHCVAGGTALPGIGICMSEGMAMLLAPGNVGRTWGAAITTTP